MITTLTLAALLPGSLFANPEGTPRYKLVEVPLPSGYIHYGSGGINSKGLIGVALTKPDIYFHETRSYSREQGWIKIPDTPPYDKRIPYDVNESGTILGYEDNYTAWTWNVRTGIVIPISFPGGTSTRLRDLNEAGHAAGMFLGSGLPFIYYRPDLAREVPLLPAMIGGEMIGINNHDEAVGTQGNGGQGQSGLIAGVYWSESTGTMNIGQPKPTNRVEAWKINDSGTIFGIFTDNDARTVRTFIKYRDGSWFLPVREGFEGIAAIRHANNRGQFISTGYRGAVLYDPRFGLLDMSEIVVGGMSGWSSTEGKGLSEAGHICGTGYKDGKWRIWIAYPLTPLPSVSYGNSPPSKD